ncbi:cytochrome P450 [Mycena galopus ATCC 62051]|nr:cytochrome P450 [Mycena galopus ATCC 62051]
MSSQSLILIAGTVATYVLFQLAKTIYEELTSPLRNLPGPQGADVVFGHFRQINNDPTLTLKWRNQFGNNFQLRSFFNKRELWTADTKALNHILVSAHLYQKGLVGQRFTKDLLGGGLIAAEGEEHKRQRKISNPAFGVPQIRKLNEIFNQKSAQLRDIWMKELAVDSRIDVFIWLSKMTLDVIGLAAFNYEFNALEPRGGPSEVHEAFTHLLNSPHAAQRQVIVRLARALIPILRYLPLPGSKDLVRTRTKMLKIAKQLFTQSKAAVMAAGGEKTATERDLLSLMVNANLSTDLPEDQRLSDVDVITQIPTFFQAGHETTSTATAWALYALSLDIRVQTKLREELFSLPNDSPTMDELNSLPYLERDAVRESLRVHAPAEFTTRVAMEDDVIPLSKPYADRRGRLYNSISIRKGTMIRIPISAVHHDKEIWGDDSSEFRPGRWEHIPDAVHSVPGVWGNLLTFGSGPHSCIGFRFAVVEMKALLFTLIRAFEFGAVVPEGDLGYTSTPVKRPLVKNEPEKGSQLPLRVTLYVHE